MTLRHRPTFHKPIYACPVSTRIQIDIHMQIFNPYVDHLTTNIQFMIYISSSRCDIVAKTNKNATHVEQIVAPKLCGMKT
jgi:hypothetical protein